MIEIIDDLFIGTDVDYMTVAGQDGWWIIHACRDPYHRDLLGYRGQRGAPKNHPEYLIAERGKVLFLNMIDPDDPAYIPREIVDAALAWIDKGLVEKEKVLVHCNQGESRSPAVGLLYLASRTNAIPCSSLNEAETEFIKLYPAYNPKSGIRGFMLKNWDLCIKAE